MTFRRNKQPAPRPHGPDGGDLRIATRTTKTYGIQYRIERYEPRRGWYFFYECSTLDEARQYLEASESARAPWHPINDTEGA